MSDYAEVSRAVNRAEGYLGDDARFDILSLDSGYPGETRDEPLEPLVPEVWIAHAERYLSEARSALGAGDRTTAIRAVAMFLGLSWGVHSYGGPEVAREQLPEVDDGFLAAARDLMPHVMDEVQPALLIDSFCALVDQPGVYPIVDDVGGALSEALRGRARQSLDGWVQTRGAEVALAAGVMRQLPSPATEHGWDVAIDVRDRLAAPLERFRRVLAEMSAEAPEHPLSSEFTEYTTHVWRTKVHPALDELEALVREASIREVFFRDVAGDLSTYAGPALGLASAITASLPDLISAVVAAAPPAVQSYSHVRQRRNLVASHDFLFLYEVGQRLRTS